MTGGGLLSRLLPWIARHHRGVLASTAIVFVAAIGIASRLTLDSDVLALLPPHNPDVRLFRETLERFGSVDYFVVGVRIPEGAPPDPYEDFADALGERLAKLAVFTSVEYKLGEPIELLAEFFPHAPLFLDAGGRDALAARLTDDAIRRRVAEVRRIVAMPQAIALKDLVKLDPLGVAPVFLDRIGAVKGPLAVDWTSGRYLSQDHRVVLVLGKPARSAQDLGFNRRLLAETESAVAEALAKWNEIAGDAALAKPTVFYGGRSVIALDDVTLIYRDIFINVLTSVVGVLLLFYLAYRRVSLLILAFAPLAFGLAVTFAFAKLAVGTLSSTTAGVAALLVGLGIDYIIVLYGRYAEERRRGGTADEALARLSVAARGVVMAAVTTAVTFFAFLATDFTGLFQMGLLIGTGILFCLIGVFLLVPAMIGWSEERHRRRESVPRLRVFAFGAERLVRWSLAAPRTTLAIAGAVTVVSLFAVPHIEFDDNMDALRPAGNRGILAQQELADHFGAGFDHFSLVLSAPTLEDALARTDRAVERIRERVAAGELGGFDAITALVPPLERQREALDWLAANRAGAVDPERVERTFRETALAEGLRPEAFDGGLALLGKALTPTGPITRETVRGTSHGTMLFDRYVQATEHGWQSVVKLYPVPGRSKREIPKAAEELVAALGPQAGLTGVPVLARSLRHEVRFDAALDAVLGFVLVAALLWAHFRRALPSLLCLVPLVLGLAWMGAAMYALDLHLNYLNIFVSTMVIGIGVDYGIYIVYRHREARALDAAARAAAVEETARSVALAAMTAIVGIGALATSHYPGLVSIGEMATLGTCAAAIASLTAVPALAELAARWQERRRSATAGSAGKASTI